MKNLTGKTALITGGASGIGLAIGRRLAESGMKIALADIETPILEEAVSELKELNYEAIGIQCDVSDLDSMKGMKSQIAETFGNPELICLNAGVGFGASISEATIGDWEWVIGVNLWGIINGLNIFLPRRGTFSRCCVIHYSHNGKSVTCFQVIFKSISSPQ